MGEWIDMNELARGKSKENARHSHRKSHETNFMESFYSEAKEIVLRASHVEKMQPRGKNRVLLKVP